MDYGNFFEYLCIGANAKGEAIKSIPLTLKGEKTTVQKRIEAQAELFGKMFDPNDKEYLGYKIVDTQVKLSGLIKETPIEGTLDIEAIRVSDGAPVVIDLKLTEDVFSDRSEYGWGNPLENIDLIQQVLYKFLYYQNRGIAPVMVLMIFEHGTGGRSRIIELDISEWRVSEMIERFESGASVLDLYKENGWTKTPSVNECEKCPLSCDKRMVQSNIFIEKQKY